MKDSRAEGEGGGKAMQAGRGEVWGQSAGDHERSDAAWRLRIGLLAERV